MKDVLKVSGIIVGVLLGVFALTFFANSVGLINYSFFAPRITAVDNKVFHESQQYNDGMLRDLENLKREYLTASPEGQQALKGTVLHRFSIYPIDRMPPDLQNFYNSLNN